MSAVVGLVCHAGSSLAWQMLDKTLHDGQDPYSFCYSWVSSDNSSQVWQMLDMTWQVGLDLVNLAWPSISNQDP